MKRPTNEGPNQGPNQGRGEGLNEIEAFRAQELLLLRATEGLSEAQRAELAALGAEDDDSYDLAAAAIDLATLPRMEMPSDVAQRILLAAGARPPRRMTAEAAPSAVTRAAIGAAIDAPIGAAIGASPATMPQQMHAPATTPQQMHAPATMPQHMRDPMHAPATMQQPPMHRPMAVPLPPGPGAPILPLAPRRSRAPMIVAWTAAVAGLAAAAGAIVWAAQKEPTVVVRRIEVPAPPQPRAPLPSEARVQLLASASDVQTLPWTATADDAARGVSGDVVWSASKQEGYLRFVGLAPNDPRLLQYQLWIFDKLRDERYPVDGGVFDVGPTGEIVIKIAPKLRVNEPVLFAITVEPPGGVVVSKRERIVVTASPAKAG